MSTDATMAEPAEETGATVERQLAHRRAIIKMEIEVTKAYDTYLLDRDKSLASKKTFDKLEKELRNCIVEGKDDQTRLPFAGDSASA